MKKLPRSVVLLFFSWGRWVCVGEGQCRGGQGREGRLVPGFSSAVTITLPGSVLIVMSVGAAAGRVGASAHDIM